MALYEVDLPPPLGACRGLDDVLERLADKAANTPKCKWVQGRMLDHTSMPEGRFPTREEPDCITTDHPVWVCQISGHAAPAESAPLAYLGVDRDTPNPRGGRYGRHETTGDLDGLVEGMTRHVGALHDAGFQTHIHVNGDAAGDVVLDAMEAVLAANPRDDHRHTLVHCETLRDDQLERMVALGVTASFFLAYVYCWGDKHRDEFLGSRRAARISPLGSAVERRLRFMIHNDTSVTPMRPSHFMWCACNRITALGEVLGANQRITPRQALRAHTIDDARQVFVEDERGSIEACKRAGFTILSANPLDDAAALKDITVKATIVAGKIAYEV